MKISSIASLLLLFALANAQDKFCMKTIIKDMYTADPAPMVYDDTLYLYTTHDEDQIVNNFYTMKNWYVYC